MIGQTIAHYRITAKLGEGGMGAVYRATDTKLDREVAIKVLPAAVAGDPERLARFEREAKVLASLNHPNIAAIYGVEERALVMELVEGETLGGPLSVDTALNYARQITDALEYAHEKGVVHRDLKPANIKVTPDGQVKILDFGLAKATDPAAAAGDPSTSPTLTIAATRAGVILGTAAYMSPEQARGQAADRRADIWAFGVVLYEMLTGKPLFRGESVGDTLAAVLKTDPDFGGLPPATPATTRRLLRRCLERDRKRRLRDIADARPDLEEASPQDVGASAAAPRLGRRAPWALAAGVLVLVSALLAGGWWRATRRPEQPLMRLNLDLGPDAALGSGSNGSDVILSPDGMRVVYRTVGADGRQRLSTRRLDEVQPTVLAGTDGATAPFFSPDGQWVGFFAGGKLKKVPVGGGASISLCDAPLPGGAGWGENGDIIAALDSRIGISRVSSSGGTPKSLKGGGSGFPQVLPGGKEVLFTSGTLATIGTGGWRLRNTGIEVLSLQTGQTKTLLRDGLFGRYLPSGHLVYIQAGALFAAPMDLARLELTGPGVPVLEEVLFSSATGGVQFDFSRTGTVIYVRGKEASPKLSVQWLTSTGKMAPLLAKPGNYFWPRLSPEGRSLAMTAPGEMNDDLWLYDWQRDTMSRLTFGPNNNRDPVWSPDGKYIAFASGTTANLNLYWIRSDRAGEPQRLAESKNLQIPYSFSPDGKWLAFYERDASARALQADIWVLPIDRADPDNPRPGKPEVFLSTPFSELRPVFSPDGRWLAYESDESGAPEVYLRSFPGRGGQRQISSGGGVFPVWSRKGHELFYRAPDNRIMAAAYAAKGDSFVAEKPQVWSPTQITETDVYPNFDPAPGGGRFAVMMAAEGTGKEKPPTQVTFLLNFFDELRRRVPQGK